jgi:antitoxin YefM
MDTTLSLDQALEEFARLPDRFAAEQQPQPITVTRQGQPVMVIFPWDLFESLNETLEILGDPAALADLRRGEDDLAGGAMSDWAAAKARLGL